MPKSSTWKHCLATLLCLFMSIALYAQTQTVNGIVKDSSGEAILGASILEKGTANGCTTDIDGKFSLKVQPGASLLVSYVGYETQEMKASSNMTITLVENAELVDEVVVVGYGTQKKKLVTGATIQVSGDDLLKQGTTNALGALYSSVPGVNIVASNGQPGADYNITIRGLNTTGNSKPLYVIDGVAGGSISSLNPSDIESIDILKDAASAAIYGARASAGVIFVTTKQGEKGKIRVNYDGYFAKQKPNFNGVRSVTASRYIEMCGDELKAAGIDIARDMPVQYAQMQAGTWNGTDWLRESVNPDSYSYNNSLTITGGSDKNHFSAGITNSHSDGFLGYPKKTYFERTTIRMNSDYVLWNNNKRDVVKLGENFTMSLVSNNGVSQGNIYSNQINQMLKYTPLLPAYNADGSFYSYQDQLRDGWQASEGAINLLEQASLEDQENHTLRFQGNVWLEINPIQDLKLRSVYGFRYYNRNARSYTPEYQLSGTEKHEYDEVSQSSSISSNWTWENTAAWSHKYGKHNVDALVGISMEGTGWGQGLGGSRKYTKMQTWEGANLSSSDSSIDPANVDISGSNTVPYNDLLSFFARANYNYKETYLATVIFRRDGSSNFGKDRQWGNFTSVSAGWVLTNEAFLESTKEWLDFLKLRANWGQNGNCSVTPFQYAGVISLDAPYDFSATGINTSTGGFPKLIPNPNLKWETTEQTNIGLDARFLSSRLGLVLDWYNKETKDWLVNAPSLASHGTGAPTINGGAVRNRGIELGLNWNDHIGDFRYGASFNISHNKNKVLYIDNADGILHGGTNVIAQNIDKYNTFEARPGKPIGYFTGIASEGIFQTQAQIDAYKDKGYAFIDGYEKAKPGDVIWIDQNGDGIYNEGDIVEVGNPHPDVNIGFNINLAWKGFDLSISGSGAFGHQIVQSYRSFANSNIQNYTTNVDKRFWTGEGSTNSFPRFESNGKHNNFYCNGYLGDIWCQDADYVKIRTITLGYDFKQLFKKLPLQQLRIYFTGQNLLTFTGYDGMDPEVGYGYGYSWASGIDIGSYPSPKTYMFGASVKF